MLRSRPTPALVLAAALLVAAVGVDLLWLRPQERSFQSLSARKQAAEAALDRAGTSRREAQAILGYAGGAGADTTGWEAAYAGRNPLRILEGIRKDAGLRSLDVSLEHRTAAGAFERTTYFMVVYGSFTRQIRFLKALEASVPLIEVNAFTMDTREEDPRVTLRLTVSVLTLKES